MSPIYVLNKSVNFWCTESWRNLTGVTMNLSTTPEIYHRTTLWNTELICLIKVTWFPWKKWMSLKTAGCYVAWLLEFQASNITRYGNPLDLGQVPSVLWRCWLGGRKGIRPVKTECWGTGVVICLDHIIPGKSYAPADATATPSCLAPVKSRMVYLSGANLPRLSWKKVR